MRFMKTNATTQGLRGLAAGLSLVGLGACSLLSPSAAPPAVYYSLDGAQTVATARGPGTATAATATLIVNPPHASAGFDSPRIIYVRQPHKLEYFAHSEWVDAPARMLASRLITAIETSGAFRAVVLAPGAAAGDLRLDTEIIRLQHEFGTPPSRVRFTLRATLVDDKTRRVLAWREFDDTAVATSEDAYGGVVAANQAVGRVLAELSQYLATRSR